MSGLTVEQETRLDMLEPETRVIGLTREGNPIVRRPNGNVSAVNWAGRLVPAPGHGRNQRGRKT